ncbi:MAG: hypothetical protein HRU25_13270 [Psychrobium sp.]|nr:hypothetical protein [Psychrobium sp.]
MATAIAQTEIPLTKNRRSVFEITSAEELTQRFLTNTPPKQISIPTI